MTAKERQARKQLVVEEIVAEHGLGQAGHAVRWAIGDAFDRGVGLGFEEGERAAQPFDRPTLR